MAREVVLPINLRQVMTFRAHRVRPRHAQVRSRKQVCNHPTWGHSLTEFISALQQVQPPGAMRTVGSGAAKFAVIVGVVAVAA